MCRIYYQCSRGKGNKVNSVLTFICKNKSQQIFKMLPNNSWSNISCSFQDPARLIGKQKTRLELRFNSYKFILWQIIVKRAQRDKSQSNDWPGKHSSTSGLTVRVKSVYFFCDIVYIYMYLYVSCMTFRCFVFIDLSSYHTNYRRLFLCLGLDKQRREQF